MHPNGYEEDTLLLHGSSTAIALLYKRKRKTIVRAFIYVLCLYELGRNKHDLLRKHYVVVVVVVVVTFLQQGKS